MIKKALKFDNIELNKNEFHASKQPITLDLVNINQMFISDKFEQFLNILLVTKKMILLNLYVLYCLK